MNFTQENSSLNEEKSPKNKSVKRKTPPSKKKTPSPKKKTPSPKKKTPSPKKKTPSPTRKKTPSPKRKTPSPTRKKTPTSATPIKQLKWSKESFQILNWLRKNNPEEYEKYFHYSDNNSQIEFIESYRDMWNKATLNDLKDLEYKDIIGWLEKFKQDEYSEFEKLPILEKKEFINNNKDRWIREAKTRNDLVILLNLPKAQNADPTTVPESVTKNVESFMLFFSSIETTASPQSRDIVKYFGMEPLVRDLFYIRLLEKYKNDCVLPKIKFGYIFTNTMTSYDILILAINIVNCVKRGTYLFIIPVTIIFPDNTGHENMLIYRVNITDDNHPTHVIEHFEPHGAIFLIKTDEEVENATNNIQNKILKLQEEIKKIYSEKGKPIETEYISPREVCPVIRGIQYTDYSPTFGGFCGLWSFFFAELTVLNPTISSKVLYSSLIDLSRQDKAYIDKILVGYIIEISKDIFEMFGEIFEITDKKNIIKIIGRLSSMDTIDKDMFENISLRVTQYISNKYRDSQDETDNIDYLDKLKGIDETIDETKMMRMNINELEPFLDELFRHYETTKTTTGNPPRILIDIYKKMYQEYENTIKELLEKIAKEQTNSSYSNELQEKLDNLQKNFVDFKEKYSFINVWIYLKSSKRK